MAPSWRVVSPLSISLPSLHSRKRSAADVLKALGDDHIGEAGQADLGVVQHLFSSLPRSESAQRSSASTQREPVRSSASRPSFSLHFFSPPPPSVVPTQRLSLSRTT